MKSNKFILLIAAAGLVLTACGGKGGNDDSSNTSSQDSIENSSNSLADSSNNNNSSSSESPINDEGFVAGLSGLPQIDDDAKHDAAGWIKDNFAELFENAYYGKDRIKSFNYTRDVYLRSQGNLAAHEILDTKYVFQTDRNFGDVLTGRATVTPGTGVLTTDPISAAAYYYDIQAYAAGGYLHYLEKVPKQPNTPNRVSYDSISKNNRYNNIYTIYSANPDKALIKSAYQFVVDNIPTTMDIVADYIDTSTDEVILKIATEEYVAYTDYMYYDFVYAHADKQTRKLTRVDYGWIIYDNGGSMSNEKNIQTIRCESIYNLNYSSRDEFKGTFLTEKDVDKVYGGPAQHYVDYSKWADGVLSDENAQEITANLQVFGSNTVKTQATFSVDQFMDPANYVDMDGEFNILGTLRGTYTTSKYDNDFVETKGTATLTTESGAFIEDFNVTIQAEANDDGMYVIESYDTDKMYSHKHTWQDSEIDDTDPYIGVNPIFRDEMFHPFEIVGKYGINNPGVGDDDDEIPTNFYSTNGALVKQGKTITGSFSKIYHKNIWTPYWTYTASFKIEDSFLSEFSLSISSYYETDSSVYTIKSSFSFVNTKGTTLGEFKGTKLNPNDFEESDLLAKNEKLYK